MADIWPIKLLFHLILLCFAVFPAKSFIVSSLQMQLGNPSGATADTNNHDHYLIQRDVQALDYSDNLGVPVWASWDLTAGDVGSASRSTVFFTDTNLPPNFYRVTTTDYNGVGTNNLNRGHLCPSEDRTDTRANNDAVFFMSNIMPQNDVNNQGVWGGFETYCRNQLSTNELLIICGPSGFGTNRIPSGKAYVPDYVWKIVVVVPTNSGPALSRITTTNRVIALKLPNNSSATNSWPFYVTSVAQIEVDTGFTFFTALPTNVAGVLRNKVDGQTNAPPAVFAFVPTTGSTGTTVVITGTNFTSTTTVTFNGVSAAFTVNSGAQITAMVPTNSSSGFISVTASGGTAISTNNFIVTGSSGTNAAPLVYSFLPPSGSTGTNVVITGTNFTAATTVTFNGVTAAFTLNSGTQITAIVPTNDLTGFIGVTTPSGTAYSTNNFIVIVGGGTNFSGVLAGWDVSTQSSFGPSPLAATSNAPNLAIVGLTRGSGVKTSGSGAGGGWGGNGFTNTSAASAIASNALISFSLMANSGYQVSFTSLNRFDYRRSGTGPTNSVLQFQVGNGAFTDILTFSNSSATGGATNAPINLSGFTALQNVGANTNVTFRIVSYNAGSSAGTWYVWDFAGNTGLDLSVLGTVTAVTTVPTPLQAWRQLWFGTTNNTGTAADTYVGSSDGMANLLKYALNLNPTLATTNPVMGDISTGYLRLTTTRNTNATDVTLSGQLSGDLAIWTTNGTVVDQNGPVFQVHDSTPVTGGTNRFLRLRVTLP